MDKEKKYELIPSDREGLYRVKALKDFNDVKKGDIGGYVESEYNLSHDGNCWIYDYAIVRGKAQVYHNAVVRRYARVWGEAQIYDNAIIDDNAQVYGNTIIYDKVQVGGFAQVCGHAQVRDKTRVYCIAVIQDDAVVMGNAEVCGDAIITSDKDYIVFKNWWSSGRYFTWTRSNNMWKVGCFYGSGDDLVIKAYKDSEESGKEYEKIVKYVKSII